MQGSMGVSNRAGRHSHEFNLGAANFNRRKVTPEKGILKYEGAKTGENVVY